MSDETRLSEQYRRAFDVLREGGVVALPTDTVYGLCAVATDDAAVRLLYGIKRRRPDQPLPLFVSGIEQAEIVADVSHAARRLAAAFWPGALTVVLRRKATFGTLAAAGGVTVGLRAPADAVLREMAAQLGPITGTSANLSGRPECRTAAEVREQLGDAVDLIVDAPVAGDASPSTVVDCTADDVVSMLREGGVSRGAIGQTLAGAARLE